MTCHTTQWPADPQWNALDEGEPESRPRVPLSVGAGKPYSAVEIMHEAPFTTGAPDPHAQVVTGELRVDNPGYCVLRFDVTGGQGSDSVKFEVVACSDHATAPVFAGTQPWSIGTQIADAQHDGDAPFYPYGYLHSGQPYAPDIYAGQAWSTGQIIPVNSSDVHGPLEVWWFEEGSYAPGVFWPNKVVSYNAAWPAETAEIVIASRLGAGSYPSGSAIYDVGLPSDNQLTTSGWNPNDEHAILLPISGTYRAFAVRDDNPRRLTTVSGHPWVLVKYRDSTPPNLWRLGVHHVVAEQDPYFLDYTEYVSQSDPVVTLPVVAGLPIDPLFPVNFAAAPCLNTNGPLTYVDGDAVWVARDGTIYGVEQWDDIPGSHQPSMGTIHLWENWAPDGGCQPWRAYGPDGQGPGTDPWPIIYRPSWPPYPGGEPDCIYPTDPECARPLQIGETVVWGPGQEMCGAIAVLHDSVGQRILDPTYEVSVAYTPLAPDVDFTKLPPHLYDGEIGGGGDWPDRVRYDLGVFSFQGVMSARDREFLYGLSANATYRSKVDALYQASRVQLTTPLVAAAKKTVTVGDVAAQPGWITLGFQNDDACSPLPVSVEVWHVACPPHPGAIRIIQPQCVFNEKTVLQFMGDCGGEPENLVFHWQWSDDPESGIWHDYSPPTGYVNGVGLREVLIEGASEFTVADSWWRVRYRGYPSCPAEYDPDPTTPWPAFLSTNGGDTQISEWTDPQLNEGWVKRVVNGLNLFDQRVDDFHVDAVATYVQMIRQAGIRFEAPVPMNCEPATINALGLIEAYETVLRRVKAFSIELGISYTPANVAILLAASKVVDLYLLLGNEAFADASDPTIGLFVGEDPPPAPADPHAAFCFEGQVPSVLEEELDLLRGRDQVRPPDTDPYGGIIATVYNRLPWNFTSGDGEVAYANHYQVTDVVAARELYPQGHGDAWGHYLTATKKFYDLLRHPVFDWIVTTESVLVAGAPVEVGFQYERKFARAAAAKARTGAAVTALTFRQRYTADPTQQDGYPDTDPQRAWGVKEWAQRAGQGAYFDWLTANALLDDDDDQPDHAGTIQQIDRTTVTELREIAAAYSEIQTSLDNADAGLNPLGLATNVVPFGLSPSQIEAGKTHFDQISERAVTALTNAVTAFDYANENQRRLRLLQDQADKFAQLTAERELDFKGRLIEIFGRPYAEDVGPGKTYASGYTGPDIYHFEYVDPSVLIGQDSSSRTTTISVTLQDIDVNPSTGALIQVPKLVQFSVSTDGLGLVKPAGWAERPVPGEIQFARSELVQAIGRYLQALENYEAQLDQVEIQADLLESLYQLNRNQLQIMYAGLGLQRSLNDQIRDSRAQQLRLRRFANDAIVVSNAYAEGLPLFVIGGTSVGGDPTAPIRSAIRLAGAVLARILNEQADNASMVELQLQQDQQMAAAEQQIEITGGQGVYQAQQAIAGLRQLVRALPAMRLENHMLEEAIRQATGRYHATISRGLLLVEQRTLFRQQTAETVSQYRYRDMAFRVFTNDALQKYRAQFDLAARYVYLAAKAYDYETNLLGTDAESGRAFLAGIVRQRSLGVINGGVPMVGNGLAGQFAQMWLNYDLVLRAQLGFNSPDEFERTFSLRWELFRIPNTLQYDANWRSMLASHVVTDLNQLQEYAQYCQPLLPATNPDPAIVIPFETTVQSGLNLFRWPSTGDETLPADRFAIKLHYYGVQFANYPGSPLNNQVPVYFVPVGSDVMRVPTIAGTPREWRLLDQTLPVPFPLTTTNLNTVGWLPWDGLSGGSAAMVQRRLIPTVSACSTSVPSCDLSYKLIGRSVWNTQWLLIIPGSQLQGSNPANGINVFINGLSGTGVRDIKLKFKCYGYSGAARGSESEEDGGPGGG